MQCVFLRMLTLYSELTLSNKFIPTKNLLSPLHLLPGKRMDQPREVWRAPHTKKGSQSFGLTPSLLKRRLPTLPLLRSTIGVTRLNFSVRNGKRWIPRAITTLMPLKKVLTLDIVERLTRLTRKALTAFDISTFPQAKVSGY